ncbi:MAG: hypothetical protein Q4B82_03370 [Alysiella sp.]|uniref:hypothetical protein n=1 Tax=Alysiella sp. TaxID=1872483 RepID=UPI0026DC074A|nr:hypothetical protein [Alysiella sp.]MDO4433602.1 hypothetical protein [Alysiella sp.]
MREIHIYHSKISLLIDILLPYAVLAGLYWWFDGSPWQQQAREMLPILKEINWLAWLQKIWDTEWGIFLIFVGMLVLNLLWGILSSFRQTYWNIIYLFQKKPQITINAYNISSHREQISMAWDNIASFEFRNYKGNVSLILVYRPTSSDERLQPENPQSNWQNLKNYLKTHLKQQNAYLSLNNLAVDEKKLGELFTQLIATQDPAQREIWIHQFQAA